MEFLDRKLINILEFLVFLLGYIDGGLRIVVNVLEFLKKIWRKILTVVGIVIAIWLLCPLPEISILVGFLTGSSVHNYLNVPAWTAYAGSLVGALIGTLILRQLGWIQVMKSFFKEKFFGADEDK